MDLTEFPIVRTTLPELVDAPIIVAIFAGLRRAEERGVPYVHIADLSAVDSIETAGAINAVRTESAANEVRGPSNCTASAVIAPSVFLRSVVRAAFAFARRGIDRQVFSTRSRANEWAHARVAATTDPSRDTK